jgi:hypothetical protein
VDLTLHWLGVLELPPDELSFYRPALKRIFETCFGFHKRGEGMLKSRVALPIFSKSGQICFEAGFLRALLTEISLDRLVQQLLDGSSLEFTEVLGRSALPRRFSK